ncbi:MAG: hypothetical protein ACR2GV_04340 [Gaiellaceae bacterium]
MQRKHAIPASIGVVVVCVLAAIGAGSAAVADSGTATAARPCASSAPTHIPQPTSRELAAAGLKGLPLAPKRKRVDLVAPRFSNSANVTNPLFPISKLHSAILNGKVSGKVFRVETTLLPDTRIIEWKNGKCVWTLVSQYVAYLDGRIEEVALDFYAQADDGSVWYFGEDVYNYAGGVVRDTSGTWLAGKEGPAAMIMPGAPKVGDVNRPENIPGLVFEEVAVKEISKTVAGPRGQVKGALVGRELHDDGTFSDKVFAPGYGEFFTAHEGDVEALALAVPTSALCRGPAERAHEASVGRKCSLRQGWKQALAGSLRHRRKDEGRLECSACARRATEARRTDQRGPRSSRASGRSSRFAEGSQRSSRRGPGRPRSRAQL